MGYVGTSRTETCSKQQTIHKGDSEKEIFEVKPGRRAQGRKEGAEKNEIKVEKQEGAWPGGALEANGMSLDFNFKCSTRLLEGFEHGTDILF